MSAGLTDVTSGANSLRCATSTRQSPDALVASTEFLTELQAWAADRNEQREDGYIEAVVGEQDRAERAAERDDAARQLAEILKAHNTAQDID